MNPGEERIGFSNVPTTINLLRDFAGLLEKTSFPLQPK